ncbi:hypothetical protein J3R82DRAFT_2044, partial [Butyriboletus roseoflavus]
TSIFQNKGVQQVINEVLFKNKFSEGIQFPEYYQLFSILGYTLALMVIVECAIDEWASGLHEHIKFTKYNCVTLYNKHVEKLENFDKKTQKAKALP